MSLTLTRQIPIIAPAGNDALIKASYVTAFTSSGVVSSVSIAIASGGASGSSFILNINGVNYEFAYEQFGADLFACLSTTAVLIRYFIITKSGSKTILTTRTSEAPSINLGTCNNIVLDFGKSYLGTPIVANNARWLLSLEKKGSNKLIGPVESVPEPTGAEFTGEATFNAANLLPKNRRGLFTFPNTDKLYVQNMLEQFTPHIFIQEGIPAAHTNYVKGTPFFALYGTLSETRLASINSKSQTFADLLTSSKMFLSWKQTTRETDIYTPQRLFFIAQTAGTYSLKVQKWYTDGSASKIEQLSTIVATAYQTIEACCSWADVRTSTDPSPLQYYEVWLEVSSVAVSERRRFVMDYTYYSYARYWLYRNSLGAYDIIRTTGKAKQTLDVQKAISRTALPNDFTEQNASTRQLSESASIKYVINSGYLETSETIEYQEFLRSGEVYWIRNGALSPVQIPAKTYDIATDDEDMPFIEFEVELAQSDDYMVAANPLLPVAIGDFDDDFNEDYLA